jgi:hypothetical protein
VTDGRFCTTDLLPLMARKLGIDYPWEEAPCEPGEVRVQRVANLELGEGLTAAPLAEVLRQRGEFVARIDGLFGTGTGWGPVFALGPARNLVGTRPQALPLAGTTASAEIEDPERFRAGRVAETLLRGSLDGVDAGAPLAVAVNGEVVATGRSFEADGETRFSILFDPAELRSGINVIELYEVQPGAGGPRLALLGSAL